MKKISGRKIFGWEKFFESKKFLVENCFGFGVKKIIGRKNFGSEKFFELKKILVKKVLWVKNIFRVEKCFWVGWVGGWKIRD